MRHRGLLLGLVACAVVASPACTRNPNTEYVAGFSTQVQVPKEFKSLEVSVLASNDVSQPPTVVGCEHIPVVNGVARLPKTFGIYRQSSAANMTVTVIGFTEDAETISKQRANCDLMPSGAEGTARILRRSRQNYRDGKVLYLPMPLKYACFDVECQKPGELQNDQTCVAGQCVSGKRSEFVFRDYSPDLAFGDSSACFSSNRCMADAIDPKVEDADKCIYSVPGTADGMNVRVIYDGFVPEMLDLDNVLPPGFDQLTPEQQAGVKADLTANQEGFTILSPGKFQLAPGLCELTKAASKGKHRILGLSASRSCAPKSNPMPMCDEGVEILTPAASRVYVLLDRSVDMQTLLGKEAVAQALGISLNDPVFSTTQVGFRWLPSKGSATCPPAADFLKPDITDPKDASKWLTALPARDAIVEELKKQPSYPSVTTTSLETALSATGVYGALATDAAKFNRQAVFILTNSSVGNGCSGTDAAAAINAQVAAALGANKQGVKTYLVELGVKDHTADGDALRTLHDQQANALAAAGGARSDGTAYLVTNGTLDPQDKNNGVVAQALNDLIGDLASCLYERPQSVTDTSVIKITTNTNPTEIPRNTGCSLATRDSADGWNLEANDSLIRICGSSCKKIHDDTGALSGFAAARKANAATGGVSGNPPPPDGPPALFVTATAPVKKP